MKKAVSTFLARPRWVMAVAILIPAILWADTLIFQIRRFGQPFEGSIHDAYGTVSFLSKYDCSGWQAGMRGRDVVVAVNGQPWSQLLPVVQETGIGGTVVCTVLRNGQALGFAVPIKPFTLSVISQTTPPALFFTVVVMIVGLFVYSHNQNGGLNRLILLYNVLWAVAQWSGVDWTHGRQTLSAYLLGPIFALAHAGGWTFF